MNYPEQIKERVEKGMGCHSHIGKGWFDLVIQLDKDISKLVPDYKIDQVKEKFGGLRFYIGSISEDVFDEVYNIIHVAENKSYDICDICGGLGNREGSKGWIVTRCPDHKEK